MLVRDPVQRAYSHWKMGHEWFESKEECGVEQVIAQGLPAGDLEPTEMEALRAQERKAARARRAAAAAPASADEAASTTQINSEPAPLSKAPPSPSFSLPARPERAALDSSHHVSAADAARPPASP